MSTVQIVLILRNAPKREFVHLTNLLFSAESIYHQRMLITTDTIKEPHHFAFDKSECLQLSHFLSLYDWNKENYENILIKQLNKDAQNKFLK